MRCHRLTVYTLLGIALAGSARPVMAAEVPSTKARVAALLQTGWTRSLQSRKDAQQQYDRLAGRAAGDWRIPYAYALVQIQQYRYADAAKLLDQVLKLDRKNAEANRLRLWLAVILKDYPGALGRMRDLVDALPPEPADAAADAASRELALLLGRVCGFMEGPVKSNVDQAAQAACARRLDGRLTGARKAAFDKGRAAVLRQFHAAGDEQESTRSEARHAGEKIKDQVVDEYKQHVADLSKKLDAEQARLSELRKTLDHELDQATRDAKSAGQRLKGEQAGAQQTGLRLREFDARIGGLYDLAIRDKEPSRRQQYLLDALQAEEQRDQHMAELGARYQGMAAETAKLRELQQRRTEIEARWQKESGGAAKLEGSLKRTVRNQEHYEKKVVDSTTPQVVSQQRRSVALSTYVPLPVVLEAERARVLTLFDAK